MSVTTSRPNFLRKEPPLYVKAVIMAGGEGTRLRPLTCSLPKPMVPILNKPMMEHILNLLKRHGITRIASTLCICPAKLRITSKTDLALAWKWNTTWKPNHWERRAA